jgi:hypothetical protein
MSVRLYNNDFTNCIRFSSRVDNLHVLGRIKLANGEKDDLTPTTHEIKKYQF